MNKYDTNDFNIRLLDKFDYFSNYFLVLSQLTAVQDGVDITYDDFCDQLDKIKSEIYVVTPINDDSNIVATASILIEHKFIHHLGSVAHIEDVVVSSDCRGYGLGKFIIKHLVDYALEYHNVYKVILDCDDKNIEFYEKCGFSRKGNCMAKYA